jgi:hypothetical protein
MKGIQWIWMQKRIKTIIITTTDNQAFLSFSFTEDVLFLSPTLLGNKLTLKGS